MPKKVAAIRSSHVRTKSGLRNGYFWETRRRIPKVRGFPGAVIRDETRKGCWRWISLRRASQAYRPFLFGWLPGTLKAADGGFEDCKRNAFSFIRLPLIAAGLFFGCWLHSCDFLWRVLLLACGQVRRSHCPQQFFLLRSVSALCLPPASSGLVQPAFGFPPAALALGLLRCWCVCLIVRNQMPFHVFFWCGLRSTHSRRML